MRKQKDTAEVLVVVLAGNLIQDTEGIDVPASAAMYADLVEGEMKAEVPWALVKTEVSMAEGAGKELYINAPTAAQDEAIRAAYERATDRVCAEGGWVVIK